MTKYYALLLLITLLLGSFNNVSAQTNVAGGNVSGTWTLAGSPYLINGSIQIPNGQTLTIEPGVTVNFQGTYKLYMQGRLLAIGTEADSIIFTAADTTIGWRGIRFDNTPSSNDTSKLTYCKLQLGKATGTGDDSKGGSLYFENFSKVIISNCHISNCTANGYGGGIYCYTSSPTIINNTISNNSCFIGGGIYCYSCTPKITNNAITNNLAASGGGIYFDYSSPTINNNIISNNSASIGGDCLGGGIYCDNSSPTIINNVILNNFSKEVGSGIYCDNSSPTIISNTISNNSASSVGGIYCYYSSPTITNNTISNNSASSGGGINCGDYSSPTITNNIISNNSVNNNGAGINCSYNSSPTITNNTIFNNSANNNGGGIYCYVNSSPIITNNIISNNSANNGGGIYCYTNSNPTIINSTISNNSASNYGGGIYCYNNSNPTMYNCILCGNTANINGSQLYLNNEDSDPDFYYCEVQGGTAVFGLNDVFYTGIYQNNIDSDPLFVAPTAGSGTSYDGTTADWSLQNNSPCINAGTPDITGLNLPTTDIAGNPRVSNGRIDIGAYEHLGTSINNPITNNLINIYPNPNNGKFLLYLENYESKNYTLEIYDITGQIIYSDNYENKTFLAENIVLSQFESGVYFVKVIAGNSNYSKNMVIIK